MPTFQSTVRRDMAAGIVGELAFDGPLRSQPGLPVDGESVIIGRFYTKDADTGRYSAGGEIAEDGSVIFGGIAINPKEFASFGNLTDGPLGPTLTLPEGAPGSFLEMGSPWLAAPATTPVKDGMDLHYVIATGVITPVVKGTAPASGSAAIPNAEVYRVPNQAMTAGTVYVAKLTN